MECSVSTGNKIERATSASTILTIKNFSSYRDPNTIKTLDIFDQSGKWITDNFKSIDDQTVFEAKLGVIKSLDAPVEAGSKGQDMFIFGLSQVTNIFDCQLILSDLIVAYSTGYAERISTTSSQRSAR